MISDEGILHCPYCEFEYSHLVGTLVLEFDEEESEGKAKRLVLNNKHSLEINEPYQFSSGRSNIHLLFKCEDGHYFIQSYDNYKGNTVVNKNSFMDELVEHMNRFKMGSDLLAKIESYFISKSLK